MDKFGRKKNVDGKNAEKKMSRKKCRMKITVKYLEGESESGGEDDRGE
jgi:hypothetical protein